MTLLLMDSFHYNGQNPNPKHPSPSDTITTGALGTGRYGGYRADMGSGLYWNTNEQTVFAGLNAFVPATYRSFIALKDGTTWQIVVMLNTNYYIEVRAGGMTGTLLWTSSETYKINYWYHFALKVYFHATAGTIDLWIDGVNVCSLTSKNTAPSGNLRATAIGNPGAAAYVCDVWVDNATNWGEQRIIQLVPSANDAVQWTPSTGANYATVDDPQLVTTDYNSTGTVGNQDTFALSDLPGGISSPTYAIQVCFAVSKDDAGPTGVKGVVISGGNTYLFPNTDYSPGTAATYVKQFYENDPAGGSWDPTKINALKVGYRRTA